MLFDAANAGVDAGDYARVADAARRAADLPRSDDDGDTLLVDLLVGVGSLLEGKSAPRRRASSRLSRGPTSSTSRAGSSGRVAAQGRSATTRKKPSSCAAPSRALARRLW